MGDTTQSKQNSPDRSHSPILHEVGIRKGPSTPLSPRNDDCRADWYARGWYILFYVALAGCIAYGIYGDVMFRRELHELNSTAQRHVTEWLAAFASASSVSLMVDSKADALAAAHVMGML